MPVTQTGRRLLSEDDIIARASDVQAVICPSCKGEGFIDWALCPTCLTAGAILIPKHKPGISPRLLWVAVLLAFDVALAGVLVWSMWR